MAVLLQNTQETVSSVPFSLHKVPDGVVTAGLSDDLDDNYGVRWWIVLALSDGRIISFGRDNWGQVPDAINVKRIKDLAVELNRDHHFDGHWVVGYNFTDNEVFALWRDKDGDSQFDYSMDRLTGHALDSRLYPQIDNCVKAHKTWREWVFKDMETRPQDTFKRALGEKSGAAH